jgi:hypothetical protein
MSANPLWSATQQQGMINQTQWPTPGQSRDWMIDGQSMTLDEFANTLWPEATAEKTFFYLKYSR